MITALLSFMGTSVGGAVFGFISTWLQGRTELKKEQIRADHDKTLAANKQLADHYKNLTANDNDGSFSRTIEFVIGMLALTVCYAIYICFTYPDTLLLTLNPEEVPKKFSLLFGLFSYERTSSKVIQISTGGVGLMLCYPIVFILSSVCTGVVSRKIR